MKVGFIGIGQMGAPMAMRLIDAGHALTIFNRTISAAQALAERGARLARSPLETLEADVVVTMLADDAAVRSIWLAPELALKTPAETVGSGIYLVQAQAATTHSLAAHKRSALVSASWRVAPVAGKCLVGPCASAPQALLNAATTSQRACAH